MITAKGIVKNGVIVLEDGVTPPSDGTSVQVQFAEPSAQNKSQPESIPGESLNALLLRFAGKAKGKYPRDMARNHDHYLYGTPKRPESE